jgi:hypothetical protein
MREQKAKLKKQGFDPSALQKKAELKAAALAPGSSPSTPYGTRPGSSASASAVSFVGSAGMPPGSAGSGQSGGGQSGGVGGKLKPSITETICNSNSELILLYIR